jgi:hypothetical protein
MFFSQDARDKVRKDNPDASFGESLYRLKEEIHTDGRLFLGEIGRMLGAAWKEMKDSDKKPYQDMAERDKTRAETEKAAYVRHLLNNVFVYEEI